MTIIGIHTNAQNKPLRDLIEVWKHADALGYGWISISDHFPGSLGPMSNEAVATHAAMAASTSRVTCGVFCYSVGFRHPAVLATAVTTIDHLSGGRAAIGIGSGSVPRDYEIYGFPWGTPGFRSDVLEESTQIIAELLRGETVDFHGEHFNITGASLQERPLQARLPLWVGGGGEKRTMRIAARFADGWNGPAAPDDFARKVKVLHAHCEDIGRDPTDIKISTNPMLLLGQDPPAGGGPMAAAALTGSVQQVVDRVHAYAEAGADQVNFFLPHPWPLDGLAELAEAFGLQANAEV